MKKTMKSFLALAMCAVAMGFASCSKDNDANSAEGNKEFLFRAYFQLNAETVEESTELLNMQHETIQKALNDVGFTNNEMSITDKDSTAVRKILLQKMAQVEKAITDAPFAINAYLDVYGAENCIVSAEDHKRPLYYQWYDKTFGTPSNGDDDPDIYGREGKQRDYENTHEYRFIKSLKTSYSEDNGDYHVTLGSNMNSGHSKDYKKYLVAEHSGKKSKTENKFAWEPQCESQYITDVIAVYSNWKGDTIYANGRPYCYEKGVTDLNEGVHGEYIYLYVCRQKFAESDGKYYYLNTGGRNPHYEKVYTYKKQESYYMLSDAGYGCRSFHKHGGFDVNKYLHAAYTAEGHKFVERALPLYNIDENKKATYVGYIDLNRKTGPDDIRMILSYATKEGGY